MSGNARQSLSLSLEFVAIFWLIGLSLAFLPAWMHDRGLASAQIGTILGLAFWAKIPLNLSLAHLADRYRSQHRILLVVAILIVLLLPQMSRMDGFTGLLLIWGLCGALLATAIPITDSLCIIAWRSGRIDYGRTRLWGSGSFIVASVGAGWLLQRYGISLLPALMIGGAAVMVLAGLLLQPPAHAALLPARSLALVEVLRQSGFAHLLVVAALLQSSHAMLYGFATIHWQSAGLSNTLIGWLWATGVFVEIALFAGARHFADRLGWRALLMLAAVSGVVRWSGLALTTNLAWLVVLQSLHGLTFACTHLGVMSYIARRVPERYTATAQGLYDGVALGVLFGIALALSGAMYARWQGLGFFAMTMISLVALMLLAAGRRTGDR